MGAVVLARAAGAGSRTVRLARGPPADVGRTSVESRRQRMNVAWFVVLSAFIFCIGAAGVMTRRNPLVVLLCLELMLNAGNLALIAFSRMAAPATARSSR